MHVRQKIREAFKDALVGNTSAGSAIYTNPQVARRGNGPWIEVVAVEETAEPGTLYGSRRRSILIDVLIKAAASDLVCDTLDDVAEDVETVLDALDPLPMSGATADGFDFIGSQLLRDAAGLGEVGALRLRYVVVVTTSTPQG